MSVNIPDHYTISFSTNVMLLLQIKGSKLRECVTEASYTGKQASPVDQIGSVEMQDVTGRFQPKVRTDASVDRRWVTPSDFDLTQSIDTFDKLRLITDPESSYTQNAVFAAGRKIDRLIIAAFTGTAKTGEQGATSTSFTAGNEIDVAGGGANSKLNVQKLLDVKELMGRQFVDFDIEEVYVGLTARDEAALLKEIQIISSDFNGQERPVLKDGRVDRFLGLMFKHTELIESAAAGTNEVNVPVWCKSGMHLGIWNDVTTSIYQNKQLRGEPWESYIMATFGATRLEENKVYNIESYRA
ncbi:MAG: phage capsid protein [Nitrospira sp.]|nr:phage capsid protein [Nitrospira sp.]